MLTVEQVMARYSVSRSTIYRWMKMGAFPRSIRIGEDTIRWREEDLAKFDQEKAGLMQLDDAESAENEREAKADPSWKASYRELLKDENADPAAIQREIRVQLGLALDAKDNEVLGEILDRNFQLARLLEENRRLKAMVRKIKLVLKNG